eukprot:TRINITY_DN20240_c0_g1::TRINITY_DN20240_c0_g1_i1::g.19726::m.19726 TRINITY_DN20240_c0_g1::TRINITY_DN20240_c0_g1_i1::g.19726  ORF type:complete len:139 (+),score=6.13,Tmemb_18A/PF09771.4/1.8e-08,Spo7/PF03907.8/6.2e-08 TRINITY_DN20240_c0_g1_i1:189-605(+)
MNSESIELNWKTIHPYGTPPDYARQLEDMKIFEESLRQNLVTLNAMKSRYQVLLAFLVMGTAWSSWSVIQHVFEQGMWSVTWAHVPFLACVSALAYILLTDSFFMHILYPSRFATMCNSVLKEFKMEYIPASGRLRIT